MKRRDFLLGAGGAVTLAPAIRAQQKAVPVIGYLSPGSPGPLAPSVAAIRQGLSDTGDVEDQNLVIEYRWAEDHYDRLPALAADLVGRNVDVILATGAPSSALAAKTATSDDPDRLHRRRSGRGRADRQSRPAGRQSHGHDIHGRRADAQAGRAAVGAGSAG